MVQNLWWAAGHNLLALPLAGGALYSAFGLLLRPEVAAFSMAGSSLLVTINALVLQRVRLG